MLAEMGCGTAKGSWRPMLAFGVANLMVSQALYGALAIADCLYVCQVLQAAGG